MGKNALNKSFYPKTWVSRWTKLQSKALGGVHSRSFASQSTIIHVTVNGESFNTLVLHLSVAPPCILIGTEGICFLAWLMSFTASKQLIVHFQGKNHRGGRTASDRQSHGCLQCQTFVPSWASSYPYREQLQIPTGMGFQHASQKKTGKKKTWIV